MRDSETSLSVKSDAALLLFLDTICASVEQDLLKVLEGEYPTDYSNQINDLHDKIKATKQREIVFYTKVLDKVAEFVGEKKNEKITLFFDLDETIVYNTLNETTDAIRPILPLLFDTLRTHYPLIQFGICSGKGQPQIEKFMSMHKELGLKYGVSSRDASSIAKDATWGNNLNDWQWQKINTFTVIRETYGKYSFLIDDSNEPIWEQKERGICIKGGEFYGFPELLNLQK